jgi:hypothetical protein
MIRSLAFRQSSLSFIILATNSGSEFRKTENPCFAQLASPDRIGAGNSATGKFGKKTAADSDEFGGFVSGYEWFGRHYNSSVR